MHGIIGLAEFMKDRGRFPYVLQMHFHLMFPEAVYVCSPEIHGHGLPNPVSGLF